MDKPPVQLSSAQRSLGNGLTLCNKKTFFFKFSITFFFLSVCEKISRSDWNCSTVEITEHKQTYREKKELTILFISIFKRKGADEAQYFCLKYLQL